MKGSEFLRRLQNLAKKNNVKVTLVPQRGRGSHQTLYYGELKTIVRNPKDELKTGTLNAMCKQLGIRPDEL